MFVKATDQDREFLAGIRAEAWRGSLTIEQFKTRNRVLYSHPFGKRMTTYALKEKSGDILTSMDILTLQIRTKTRVEEGFLIASVITPVQYRKKGYCSQMLDAFFEKFPKMPGVLFSDIDPVFYEKFEFVLKPMNLVELSAKEGSSGITPIPASEALTFINGYRQKKLEEAEGAVVVMDPEFLEWEFARFHLSHEFANKRVPESFCWKTEHGHVLALAPYATKNQVEVLWRYPNCEKCLKVISQLTHEWSYPKAYYWDEEKNGVGIEKPMLRLPGHKANYLDPQFCDWW